MNKPIPQISNKKYSSNYKSIFKKEENLSFLSDLILEEIKEEIRDQIIKDLKSSDKKDK